MIVNVLTHFALITEAGKLFQPYLNPNPVAYNSSPLQLYK